MSTGLISNFLKSKYDNGKIPKQIFDEFPTLARVPKRSDGGGDYFITSVVIGNPQGLGATLALAQSGSQQGSPYADLKGKKWTIPWGDYSGAVLIEDKDIKRSRGNEVAFLNWLEEQIDGLHRGFLERMSQQLFAPPGRYIGYGTYATATDSFTLDNASDIVNFPIGAILQIASDDGTSTSNIIGSGSLGYVISNDATAGTFVVSATAGSGTHGTPSGWTNATKYYIYNAGDYLPIGNVIFQGLGAWNPLAAPSATAFNGVDRTVSMAALSGFRLTSAQVAGQSIKQRITRLITVMNSRGTTPGITDVILNPEKWQSLIDEMQAQGWRPLDGKDSVFNSNAVRVAIGGKMVDIVSDRHCPLGECRALTMPKDGSNIVLTSIDEFPFVIEEDGLMMARTATANNYEHRLQAYPAMAVKAPGWCGIVPV